MSDTNNTNNNKSNIENKQEECFLKGILHLYCILLYV